MIFIVVLKRLYIGGPDVYCVAPALWLSFSIVHKTLSGVRYLFWDIIVLENTKWIITICRNDLPIEVTFELKNLQNIKLALAKICSSQDVENAI